MLIPLLDSNDRIYATIVVDNGEDIDGFVIPNLRILRQLGPDVPILITTGSNSPEKEKLLRKYGIFYYHVKCVGMDDLRDAVLTAVEKAIECDKFFPFVSGS